MGFIPSVITLIGGSTLSENYAGGPATHLGDTDNFDVSLMLVAGNPTSVTSFEVRLSVSDTPAIASSWTPIPSILSTNGTSSTNGLAAQTHSISISPGETIPVRLITSNQSNAESVRVEAKTTGVPGVSDSISGSGHYTFRRS